VSAALEPGTPTLSARLERIARNGPPRSRYTVLGAVAQGGMGRILRAWDEALGREVAMKVVPRAAPLDASEDEVVDHERRLARFLDEARITAQLDHPGIVPVYEIGLDARGDVFFTMPLVRGQDLAHVFALVHADAEGWTLARALDVMHKVCLTVAFAHEKGVVHRDLKPENVMVGPFGEAYVMDWGLALLLGRPERGGIVGTPAYMSPEQASGHGEVDARSDVYSLGAILYELFARARPHEHSLDQGTRADLSFENVLGAPPRPLCELREDVPPELAAICAKAMAREPSARYASALEMARDLEAWRGGRVVSALESGPWTRFRKWRGRNRGLARALDALAVFGVVAGVAFVLRDRTWVGEVRAKHRLALEAGYAAGLSAADLALRAHEVGEAKRRLAACEPDLEGWEWRHLALRADASTRVLAGHRRGVRALAVAPDGRTLASASDVGEVLLWDATSGALRARLEGHAGDVTCLAFAPDGARLATGSRDKAVLVWDVARGELERALYAHGEDVEALSFSPDGLVLASGDRRGTLVLSEVASGTRRALAQPGTPDGVVALDFVADTGELAVAYRSGRVRLLGPELDARRELRVRSGLHALVADPRGCTLALVLDRNVRLLDAATLATLGELDALERRVGALAFAPDGARLATSGYDAVLRVWELASGRVPQEYAGHDDDVNAVAFFPDGRRLVTGSEDGSLRLWDPSRAPVLVLDERAAWQLSLAFTADGRHLAAGSLDGALRVFEVASGHELARRTLSGAVDCLAFGATDELFLGCGQPGVRRVRLDGRALERTLAPGAGFPRALAWDERRARLYERDSDGRVRVHDLGGNAGVRELATDDETHTLALSGDGRLLAAGTKDGAVRVWDAATLAPLADLPGTGTVTALALDATGARLAVGRQNRAIDVYAGPARALALALAGHENIVSCLAFAPDGARLVSGSYDGTLRIWSPTSAEALLTLHGHAQAIVAVAFDPRGEVVATASKDGTLRLWRTGAAFDEAPFH
jgi:WD40 repeat protein/tRNA A-37 threonylcarbamoyl transferase component Bud32